MTYWQRLRQWQARRIGVSVTEPGATVYAWAARRSANTHAIEVRELGGFNLCNYAPCGKNFVRFKCGTVYGLVTSAR